MFEAKQKAAATKVSIELGLEFKPLKYPTREARAVELYRRMMNLIADDSKPHWTEADREDVIEEINNRLGVDVLKLLGRD